MNDEKILQGGRMQIQLENKEGIVVFSVKGEIDLHSSPQLRQHLMEQITKGIKKILIDFSKTKYIDSSGLATLIEGLQKINANNGQLKLFGLTKSILDVFEVARLQDVFDIYDTKEDAFNEFSKK